MKKKVFVKVILCGLFFYTGVHAQGVKTGVDPKLQAAEEIKKTENTLNTKILNLNQSLARYSNLMKINIKYTPQRTQFTKDLEKQYIQLESYSFVPKSSIIPDLVGLRYKKMKIFYNGNQVSRLETEVFEQNFFTNAKYETKIVDPSPNTEDTSDIEVSSTFNNGVPSKKTLRTMRNTISTPLRVKFKRRYYVKHLVYFEKLFRFTEEFQDYYAVDADQEVYSRLKRSLDY